MLIRKFARHGRWCFNNYDGDYGDGHDDTDAHETDNGDDEGDYRHGDDHQGHVEKIEEMLLWSFGDRLQGKVEETIAWCQKNLFDLCSLSDFWNAIVRLGRREGRTSWTG